MMRLEDLATKGDVTPKSLHGYSIVAKGFHHHHHKIAFEMLNFPSSNKLHCYAAHHPQSSVSRKSSFIPEAELTSPLHWVLCLPLPGLSNIFYDCHDPVASQMLRHATFNNGLVGGVVMSDVGLDSQLRSLAVRKSAVAAHAS